MKKERRGMVGLVAIFAMVFSLAQSVYGLPTFGIGEGMEANWQQAIDGTPNGQIFAVGDPDAPDFVPDGLTGAAQMFYEQSVAQHNENNPTNELAGFQLTQTGITDGAFISDADFVIGQPPQEHESLVMSWDSAGDDMLSIGAWDYVYGADPDLSNKMIHFSILAPPGIWDLSLELIDAAGNSAGWFLSMPPNTWTNYWIDTNLQNQQGFLYFNTPGFDIKQVVAIRLDEAGVFSPTFPVNPINPNGPFFWNAWNHLQVTMPVVPEPATALLGGLGLMALSAVTRRRWA